MTGWVLDPRALFTRIVDDVVAQILDGTLRPGQRLPSVREWADIYEVSSMTAQRAQRELQTVGATYGVVGKGTFVRPDAVQRLIAGQRRSAGKAGVHGPELAAELTAYLARCHELTDQLLHDGVPSRRATQQVVGELRGAAIAHVASVLGQATPGANPGTATAPSEPVRTQRKQVEH